MSTRERSWVMLLAGGDSIRLRGRNVRGLTLDRPKQFCRIASDRTLLGHALERAAGLVARDHIVPVVAAAHRPWWEPELRQLQDRNVLEQPGNRGNAIAILHALRHVLRSEPDPLVVVLPSDHGVADEPALAAAIGTALWEACRAPDRVVLLGIAPDSPETDYGWIVPGPASRDASAVRAFVEKPSRETAACLRRQGALWNSFIFASTGAALLELYLATLPDLVDAYARHVRTAGTSARELQSLYAEIGARDFGRDLLEQAPDRLAVVRVPPCGWTDLGTPARVAAWLDRPSPGGQARGGMGGESPADALALQQSGVGALV